MFYYRAVILGMVALCLGLIAVLNVMVVDYLYLSETGSVTVVATNVRQQDAEYVAAEIATHYGSAIHFVSAEDGDVWNTVRVEAHGRITDLAAAGAPPYGTVEKSRIGPDEVTIYHLLIFNVPPAVSLAVGGTITYRRAGKLDSFGRRC